MRNPNNFTPQQIMAINNAFIEVQELEDWPSMSAEDVLDVLSNLILGDLEDEDYDG
jgi:hypothetical protein